MKANYARYRPQDAKGHYESYFLRANHPERPLAFWIRYTVFSPKGRPEQAIGELWGMVFDGETNKHVAAKTELPISQCHFDPDSFNVQIGDAFLKSGSLSGKAKTGTREIGWDLSYIGGERPLFLLPLNLYEAPLPKAKALVGRPHARFAGTITVNGEPLEIDDWVGSQNHNWGSKHTDLYAWGQVAGFTGAPDAFLEVGTAKLKFGPVWTPYMTVMVLRIDGEEYPLNGLLKSLTAKGSFDYFTWKFSSRGPGIQVDGTISAKPADFVGLTYYNPPGGIKHCLNSKIAACELTVTAGNRTQRLVTPHRAAFEILTDDRAHGIPIQV
ncbi:MAG: hypothetical protein JRI97_06800 [Deltaproteobacteria bacterium]|nr:hypothetical protein [Deltaproteobacteria bacterium]